MDCHSNNPWVSNCIGWRACYPPSDPCNMGNDQWECNIVQCNIEHSILWESYSGSCGSHNNNRYSALVLYEVMPYGFLMKEYFSFK